MAIGAINNIPIALNSLIPGMKKPKKEIAEATGSSPGPGIVTGTPITEPQQQTGEDLEYFFHVLETGNSLQIETLTDVYLAQKPIEVLFAIGLYYYNHSDYAKGRVFFDKIIERFGQGKQDDLNAFMILSEIHYYLGNYETAISILENLVFSSQDKNLANAAKAQLAIIYILLYMYEDALGILNSLKDDYPTLIKMKYDCLVGLGQIKEAKDLLANYSFEVCSFPEEELAYAELLVLKGEYSRAKEIADTYFEQEDYCLQALSVLLSIPSITSNNQALEEIASKLSQLGFIEASISVTINLLVRKDTMAQTPKEHAQLRSAIKHYEGKMLEYQRYKMQNFPSALASFQEAITLTGRTGYYPKDLLIKLMDHIPAKATRFKKMLNKLIFVLSMHEAGATKSPVNSNSTIFKHTPLNEFAASSNPNPLINDILLQDIGYPTPYFSLSNKTLLEILGKYTDRPLNELSTQEAVLMVARATERIVLKYDTNAPRADNATFPIEDKIKKGDFIFAVCRHYTAIYLFLFNALKSTNANLNNVFVFADSIVPYHVFPTIFTSDGNTVRFFSIDPAADDTTPKVFGDLLEASPLSHYQLEQYLNNAISSGNYAEAIKILTSHLQSCPPNEKPNYLYKYAEVLKMASAPKEEYIKLLGRIDSATIELKNDHSALTYLEITKAVVYLQMGDFDGAITVLDNIKELPEEHSINYENIYAKCLAAKIDHEIASGNYKQAQELIEKGLTKFNLLSSKYLFFLKYFQLLQVSSDPANKYKKLLNQITINLKTAPDDPKDPTLTTYFRLLLAQINIEAENYRAALSLLNHINQNAPPEMINNLSPTLTTLAVVCYYRSNDQKKLTAFAKLYLGLYAEISKGSISSPILDYLPDGSSILFQIGENYYQAKVVEGKVVTDEAFDQFFKANEGQNILIIINPPSQTPLPNEEKVPQDQVR